MKDKNLSVSTFIKIAAHSFSKAFFLLLFIIFFISCEKENNASLLVKVLGSGERMEQVVVYLKRNTTANPSIPLNGYDQFKVGDAVGEVYFNELIPGNYFFYAQGYSPKEYKILSGEFLLEITEMQKHNHLEIELVLK